MLQDQSGGVPLDAAGNIPPPQQQAQVVDLPDGAIVRLPNGATIPARELVNGVSQNFQREKESLAQQKAELEQLRQEAAQAAREGVKQGFREYDEQDQQGPQQNYAPQGQDAVMQMLGPYFEAYRQQAVQEIRAEMYHRDQKSKLESATKREWSDQEYLEWLNSPVDPIDVYQARLARQSNGEQRPPQQEDQQQERPRSFNDSLEEGDTRRTGVQRFDPKQLDQIIANASPEELTQLAAQAMEGEGPLAGAISDGLPAR
jgi:hypothetical protein